jgi:thiol-disulfide isomerase/thioredoxin
MHIDPKYFNSFLVVVALIAASLIAFFTLSNRKAEKSSFREKIFAQDSLQTLWWTNVQEDDSVRITDYSGDFVVLDFWSDWSETSLESHQELAKLKRQYPDTLTVIAAAVGLQKNEVNTYMEKHKFPFRFVAGSRRFSSFNIPGLPAQMIYNPKGKLQFVYLGYPGPQQYDSLRAILDYEK